MAVVFEIDAGIVHMDDCVDCLQIPCDVAFCNKVMTSISVSEKRACSTAFMPLISSNVTTSNELARRAYMVSRLGGPLGELSLSSSKSTQLVLQAK